MTDSAGVQVKAYEYASFGETVDESGTVSNDRTYTGHIEDPDLSLIFMVARYYDANLGRFISPDSLVPDVNNPQAFNRYSYVLNNPISNVDPTGHAPFINPIAKHYRKWARWYTVDSFSDTESGVRAFEIELQELYGQPTAAFFGGYGWDIRSRSNLRSDYFDVVGRYGNGPDISTLASLSGDNAFVNLSKYYVDMPLQPDAFENARLPDFINFSLNTGNWLTGYTPISATLDRYGHFYGGFGTNFGKTVSKYSWNLSAGWLNGDPTESRLYNLLSGVGTNYSAGYWLGAGYQQSQGIEDTAWLFGIYSPQGGVSYTDSWEIFDFDFEW